MEKMVLFLSFEAETYMFVDLHDWLKNEHGIPSFIISCDHSAVVNRRANEFYPPKFKNYITLEDVYVKLHKKWKSIDFQYLKRCEQIYGYPKTLNELLMSHTLINVGCRFPNATILPNANIKLKYLELTFRWAEKIITDLEPSIVFTLERNYYVKNIMFQICHSKKIPFKTLIHSRILDFHYISSYFGYGHLKAGEEILNKFGNIAEDDRRSKAVSKASQFISNYISGSLASTYKATATDLTQRKDQALLYKKMWAHLIRRIIANFRKLIRKKRFRGFLKNNWIDSSAVRKTLYTVRQTANKIKYRFIGRSIFTNCANMSLSGEYVYYALHTLPESSTLTLSTEYNELELISFLRFKIPSHISIVVKENPNMLGDRPFKFYYELKKLPNLILVDPFCASSILVRQSSGVAGISGTSLFEAAMFGKPTISFGFPEFYPLVTCKGRGEIDKFIRFCQANAEIDVSLVREYVGACFALGYEIDRRALVRIRKGQSFKRSYNNMCKVISNLLNDEGWLRP